MDGDLAREMKGPVEKHILLDENVYNILDLIYFFNNNYFYY